MTAVHDTLRQALTANVERALAGGNSNTPGAAQGRSLSARIALAVVLADPEVQRAFAITHAVDNAEVSDDGIVLLPGSRFWSTKPDTLLARLRAAGKTT